MWWLARVSDHPWVERYAPAWLTPLRASIRHRFLYQHVIPALARAQQANVGLAQVWAPPGTTPDAILRWFDEQVAAVTRAIPSDSPINHCKLFVAHCTEAEWTAAQAGAVLQLPHERMAATWEGTGWTWWGTGRDDIAAALPSEHSGLYLVANRLGATLWALGHPEGSSEAGGAATRLRSER